MNSSTGAAGASARSPAPTRTWPLRAEIARPSSRASLTPSGVSPFSLGYATWRSALRLCRYLRPSWWVVGEGAPGAAIAPIRSSPRIRPPPGGRQPLPSRRRNARSRPGPARSAPTPRASAGIGRARAGAAPSSLAGELGGARARGRSRPERRADPTRRPSRARRARRTATRPRGRTRRPSARRRARSRSASVAGSTSTMCSNDVREPRARAASDSQSVSSERVGLVERARRAAPPERSAGRRWPPTPPNAPGRPRRAAPPAGRRQRRPPSPGRRSRAARRSARSRSRRGPIDGPAAERRRPIATGAIVEVAGRARRRSAPTTRSAVAPAPQSCSAAAASPRAPGREPVEHRPRLDAAVPVVDLEPDREVVRRPLRRGEHAVRVERDSARRQRPGAAPEVEARVLALLAHRPDVADPRRGHEQPDARVALRRTGRATASCSATRRSSDSGPTTASIRSGGAQAALRDRRRGVLGEREPEVVDALGRELDARRRPGARRSGRGARRRRRAPPAGRSRGRCGRSPAPGPRRRSRARSRACRAARRPARRRSRRRPGCQPSPASDERRRLAQLVGQRAQRRLGLVA